MNTPLPFTWPFALVFWAAFVWAFSPEFSIVRRAGKQQGASDSRSLQVIMAAQSIGTFLAFGIAWTPGMLMSTAARPFAFAGGVLLLLAGTLLRRHCFRMLGASFTGDVRAHADQQVITAGAYRFVRHPSYTGGMLMNVGVALALGSWVSVAVAAVFSFVSYRYRMIVEERALLHKIGEPYRTFLSGRRRLIPFVY